MGWEGSEAEPRLETGASAADQSSVSSDGPVLSRDELDVLALLAEGHTNSQIARRLSISESTIKRRMNGAQEKLQARSRIQAAVKAVRLGLI